MSLEGKAIVITGGSGYLGSGLAAYFLDKGAKVISLSRMSLPQDGRVIFYACDIGNGEEVAHVFQEIEKEHGNIFAIVHAAWNKIERKSDTQVTEEDLNREMLNVAASHVFLQECKNLFLGRKEGAIIGITSIAMLKPEAAKNMLPYAKAKAALHNELTALRDELALVRVYSLALGFMPGGLNSDIPEAFIQIMKAKSETGALTEPLDVAQKIEKILADRPSEFLIPLAKEYKEYAS